MKRTFGHYRIASKLWGFALLGALVPAALAQSEKEADAAGNLFAKSGQHTNPFLDRIARHEGDILTVVINENSNSSYTATTTLAKTDSNNITNGIPILKGLFSALSNSATSSNAGSGATTSVGVLTAQMSVIVKKELPNGNLVIEGTRYIKTNKDVQSFKLTGIVRADDIRSDNTVSSASIQNANIVVDGKGSIADRQRRGILTRIVDWIF